MIVGKKYLCENLGGTSEGKSIRLLAGTVDPFCMGLSGKWE